MPEAQRTQDIEFIIQIIFMAEIKQTNKQTRCSCISHLHICNISFISLKYTFSDLLEIGSKFGQWMKSLALVPKLATRLSHFHCHIALDCHIGIISLY